MVEIQEVQMKIEVNTKKAVRWLWIVLIVLNSIGFAAKAINYVLGHKYDKLVRLVDVSEEANLTTWFSVELFFISAILLAVIDMAKNTAGDRWARHWTWLSVIFLYMSIDDAAQLHEVVDKALRADFHTSGFLYYPWVIVAIPFCLFLGLAYIRFIRHLQRDIRTRFICAGAIFVTSQIFVEMLTGGFIGVHAGPVPVYPILTSLEELGKYVGLVIFIQGLGNYIAADPQISPVYLNIVSPGAIAGQSDPESAAREKAVGSECGTVSV